MSHSFIKDTFGHMRQTKPLIVESGSEVIKLFSCSTQLSMEFSLLINMKMPTIVGIFIFISKDKSHAQLCLARKNLQLLVI